MRSCQMFSPLLLSPSRFLVAVVASFWWCLLTLLLASPESKIIANATSNHTQPLHHRASLHTRLLENSKRRIEARNAYLNASEANEKLAYSKITMFSPAITALLNPYYPCLFTLLRSNYVSDPGHYNGGKWTCGIPESTKRPREKPLVVYSFGSNRDDLFERHIQSINPDADITIYDPTCEPLVAWGDRFKKLAICAKGNFIVTGESENKRAKHPCKQLEQIMTANNHTYIDILKIDAEGAEFELITNTRWAELNIGQLLIEIHDFDNNVHFPRLVSDVFEPLEKAGFLHFSLEPVCSACHGQYELGFIHQNWHPELGFVHQTGGVSV